MSVFIYAALADGDLVHVMVFLDAYYLQPTVSTLHAVCRFLFERAYTAETLLVPSVLLLLPGTL